MSDEIPECPGRFQHRWSDPELADIEWWDYHDTVEVRLACDYCECVIKRKLYAGRNYDRSERLILPPLAMCEIEGCGSPIWKKGYEHRGYYYCTSSYKVNDFLCDSSPEWRVFVEEKNARRAAEAKAKKEANE